jgi:hypothetical protein
MQFRAEEEIMSTSFIAKDTDKKEATMKGGNRGTEDNEQKAANDYFADQYSGI